MSKDKQPSTDPTQFALHPEVNSISPGAAQQGQHNHGRDDVPQNTTKPKRRRRLSTTEEPPAKDRIFFFVDSNSSSREKRAYVMRHHVQEKRKQRKQSQPQTPHDRKSSQPLRYLPWKQTPHQQAYYDENDAEQRAAIRTSPDVDSLVLANMANSKHKIGAGRPHSTSLTTMLDTSRRDPFNSLPMAYTQEDNELIDFWTNKLTYWSGQNKHIKEQIFRTAMNHPLSFQAVVLGYCSRWKAQVYHSDESQIIQTHVRPVTSTIELVRKGLVDIDGDNLAVALTGLSLQEERFGSQQRGREYADQAVQILRSQAGFPTGVQVFLHYLRYITVPHHPRNDPDGPKCLLQFLRGAEEIFLKQRSAAYLSTIPERAQVFQMDSALFPLLSSGPRPTQVPQTSRLYVVRASPSQEVCRTAALIYITVTLWDFHDSPNKTRRFLAHLSTMVRHHRLDRHPACETLVWLLLEEAYESDMTNPERAWSTGELLQAHKQLRPDLQFHFNEILLSLLMLTTPIRGIDEFEKETNATTLEIVNDV